MNTSSSRSAGLLAGGICLVVCLALLAPAALAGTSTVNQQLNRDIVVFQAPGAAENNDLLVYFPNGKVAFSDNLNPVTAGAGCQQAQASNTICTRKAAHQLIVDAGPGNDKITTQAGHTAESAFYGGGTGKDTIIGTVEDEILSGNEDNDVIRPGKGSDQVYGGTGVDTLDYSERTARVVVNLAVKLGNGEANENDQLMDTSIEIVVSGSGPDELRGNGSANTLTAKGGEDRYYGMGGADTIFAREGVRDWIYCGDGTDTVYADFEDVINGDCENVLRANPGIQQGGNGNLGTVDDGEDPPPPPPAPGDLADPADPADPTPDPAPADPGSATGGSGGDATPPAAIPGDTLAPALTGTSFAPKRFRLRRGTALRYTLSEPASVKIAVRRLLPGRRSAKGACVAPTKKLVARKAKRCLRARAKGAMTLVGAEGPNRVSFTGRVNGKKLRPGAYRAVLTATDGAANRSERTRARFRVRR